MSDDGTSGHKKFRSSRHDFIARHPSDMRTGSGYGKGQLLTEDDQFAITAKMHRAVGESRLAQEEAKRLARLFNSP